MRMRGGWICGVIMVACVPDAGGAGSAAVNSLGGESDDPTAAAGSGSGGDATSIGDADGTATTSPTGPPTTGTGDARLSLSDDPTFDFGTVEPAELQVGTLTVMNIGGAEATGIAAQALSGPFSYTGGSYPGAGGTCGASLAAGQSCTLDLAYLSAIPGLFEHELALTYDQGPPATRTLAGVTHGVTDNLLVNPGGEDFGSPPPGWTDNGPGSWAAGLDSVQVDPHEGSGYHYSGNGLILSDYSLVQDIDASAWAHAIDQGLMRFTFEGWARSLEVANDQSRLRVFFLDQAGAAIDGWDTDWQVNVAWTRHDMNATAPEGTRRIRVELGCTMFAGLNCNAYFDALDLRARYP